MKKLFVLVAFVLVAAGAFGKGKLGTAEWLHDGWVEYQKPSVNADQGIDAGEFVGFVLAVKRLTQFALKWIEVPTDVSYTQIFAVVGEYLDNHPEVWNEPADLVTVDALRAVWPGKK